MSRREASRLAGPSGTAQSIALLLVITFIAYANAWPDNLVFDDRVFVDVERYSGMGPADFLRFFSENVWAASGSSGNLYRPLLLAWIALQTKLFGGLLAAYHLVNIGLHALATVCVFGFIRHLLTCCGTSPGLAGRPALLAAVIFAVHPIHTEVVNSVFNSSEMLVTIGIAGGLWRFLLVHGSRPARAWSELGVIYLLIMLCRETAVILPALAVLVLWVSSAESWRPRVRKCLAAAWLLIPLCLYLALRSYALAPPKTAPSPAAEVAQPSGQQFEIQDEPPVDGDQPEPLTEPESGPVGVDWLIEELSDQGLNFDFRRLLPAARLCYQALKIMVWPYPLQIYYDWPSIPMWEYLLVQLLLLAVAITRYVQKRPGLIAGLGFFYLAILPASRLIGEGFDPVLADRFLYLPSVGLTMVLAFALAAMVQRTNLRAAIVLAAVLSLVLTPLTWARNAQWASDVLLFESDYARLNNKREIINTLLAAHLREENYTRAAEICDETSKKLHQWSSAGIQCGTAYGQLGRFEDAEGEFLDVYGDPDVLAFARMNLGMLYLHHDRRRDAEEQFLDAINRTRRGFLKEYFRALMLLQLYPSDRSRLLEARGHLARALELQPQHVESRGELEQLDRRLKRSPAP